MRAAGLAQLVGRSLFPTTSRHSAPCRHASTKAMASPWNETERYLFDKDGYIIVPQARNATQRRSDSLRRCVGGPTGNSCQPLENAGLEAVAPHASLKFIPGVHQS